MPKFGVKIAVLCVTLLLLYGLLELFFSMTGLSYVKNPFDSCEGQQDPILHHGYVPNARCAGVSKTNEWHNITIAINSKGLRDEEYDLTSTNYRILMLGDSFTSGEFVELQDSVPKRVEQHLRRAGYAVDVINAGVGSYSPTLEYLYLRERGLEYAPDMIVLNFDLSDVHDDTFYSSTAVFENGSLARVEAVDPRLFSMSPKKVPLHARIATFIGIYSYTFNFIKDRALRPLLVSARSNGAYERGNILGDRWAITRVADQTLYGPEWNLTFSYLLDIRDLALAHNATFILVAYPYGHQVSTEEWRTGRRAEYFDDDTVYGTAAIDYLASFASANDIVFYSSVDDFMSAEQTKPGCLYFDRDPHFTKTGAHILAEGIARFLNAQNVIPTIRPEE